MALSLCLHFVTNLVGDLFSTSSTLFDGAFGAASICADLVLPKALIRFSTWDSSLVFFVSRAVAEDDASFIFIRMLWFLSFRDLFSALSSVISLDLLLTTLDSFDIIFGIGSFAIDRVLQHSKLISKLLVPRS